MVEATGSERRRAARRAIPGIEGSLRAPGDVRVLDLSLYGMSIEVAADLEVGSTVCMELRHGPHRANVEVAVRWRALGRMERGHRRFVPVSRAGVEFVDVYREGPAGIWDWIQVPEQPAD